MERQIPNSIFTRNTIILSYGTLIQVIREKDYPQYIVEFSNGFRLEFDHGDKHYDSLDRCWPIFLERIFNGLSNDTLTKS